MAFSLFSKLFDSNEKEIKKLLPVVDEINGLESKFQKLKDSDFAKKTIEFRERVAEGEPLELILPEAFALTREASKRAVGLRHFDVQFMAASVLSQGKIAEQKTGEGKTLSAVASLYLHSLTGKSVHLVTVNDYLARRDAGWMGPIFNLLGISVSAIINNDASYIFDPKYKNEDTKDIRLIHLKEISRQEAYKADVVYGINSEFGFDYLRDNMAQSVQMLRQRGYYYAIVDEVDSVLIDEARTPHIIAAPDEVPTQKYYEYAQIVGKLSSETDYKIDEKLRTAHLTDHGILKIEKLFGIADIYEKDFDTVYHLEAALKARTLFQKEKDYIVKDGEVILVDEFTGRLMVGRRLSEGLHQAIEAKEGVVIQRETKTQATVSLQNYFRMYERLTGMTGTAVTEAEEFHKIYKLDVVVIPTHRPTTRKDHSDAVYKTGRAKLTAVVHALEEAYKRGQPVLIGTTSIDKNEIVSQLLKRRGIKNEVLNAKNHEREAEIIAQAGKKGAVTVATNMAGRGVDITLGGAPGESKEDLKKWDKAHQEVLDAGGLFIIGTERHESRRIDNQLRGRAGRQGDPGTSRFFVALDDEIMRLFGGDTIASLMTRFNMPEEVPLEHALVSRAIEQAQIKVEGFNFDTRKRLVDYDDVLNKQREIIYERRKLVLEALEKENALHDEVKEKINASIADMVFRTSSMVYESGVSENQKMVEEFATIIPFDETSQKQLLTQLDQYKDSQEQVSFLNNLAIDVYEKRSQEIGKELSRQIEQFVCLNTIDMFWMDHLDAIENLRQGIGLRGYGQRDPLVEYKNEAFRMFEQLVHAIDDEIVHRIYKVQVQPATEEHQHQHLVINTPESEVSSPSTSLTPIKSGLREKGTTSNVADAKGTQEKNVQKSPSVIARNEVTKQSSQSQSDKTKLGRNDPCWCGSGKKWKKCHYPAISA